MRVVEAVRRRAHGFFDVLVELLRRQVTRVRQENRTIYDAAVTCMRSKI